MQNLSNFSSPSAQPGAPNRKVYVTELCRERLFVTDPAAEKTYDVGPQGGMEIGPYVEDLQVRVSGVNFSTNFRYKVVGSFSNDGGTTWTPFAGAVLGLTTAAGNVNSAPYTTRTDFGTLIRLQVAVSNAAGGAVENGTLSITLSVKIWT